MPIGALRIWAAYTAVFQAAVAVALVLAALLSGRHLVYSAILLGLVAVPAVCAAVRAFPGLLKGLGERARVRPGSLFAVLMLVLSCIHWAISFGVLYALFFGRFPSPDGYHYMALACLLVGEIGAAYFTWTHEKLPPASSAGGSRKSGIAQESMNGE